MKESDLPAPSPGKTFVLVADADHVTRIENEDYGKLFQDPVNHKALIVRAMSHTELCKYGWVKFCYPQVNERDEAYALSDPNQPVNGWDVKEVKGYKESLRYQDIWVRVKTKQGPSKTHTNQKNIQTKSLV